MFNFRPTYEPIIKLCKELIAEKKALMEENEELKEKLKRTEFYLRIEKESNQKITENLRDQQEEKRKDLEKRVADLEEQLAKKVYLLDDEGTPIKSFTLHGKLTFMKEPEPTEEKLEVGKWYDARTFDVETLKKLLLVGTLVEITTSLTYDERVGESPKLRLETSRVTKVVAEDNILGVTDTVIYVERFMHVSCNWFKIIEE